MKKKLISLIFMAILALCMMGGFSYGANYGNSVVSVSIPNSLQRYYTSVTSTTAYESFESYANNTYTNVHYDVYPSTGYVAYTEADVKASMDEYKKKVAADGDSLKVYNQELIELNGCKGMKFYYKRYKASSGISYWMEQYFLISDHYEYELKFQSSSGSYVGSAEQKAIVNSFKVKDTVTKSRGIPFTDVATKDWSYKAIKYVYDQSYIKGTNNYTYSPNQKLSRGMLVTILYRMENSPAVSGKTKFSDVQDSKQYYYKAVKWATDKKVVSGYNNGKFGPNDNITREQLAVILNKYAKYKGKNVSATNNLGAFKDKNKVSSYATTQMKWAVGAGVITGNSDKTLKPQGTATRAEAASMLYKYCTKVK